MSNRYQELLAFLQSNNIPCSNCDPCDCGCDCAGSLKPLSGDASFRRYYRLNLAQDKCDALCEKNQTKRGLPFYTGSVIVMDSPPDTQKNHEFVAINRILTHCHIFVPSILVSDEQNGFMVLEDMGDHLFGEVLNEDMGPPSYMKAMLDITKIGTMPLSKEQATKLEAHRNKVGEENGGASAHNIPFYDLDDADFKHLAQLPVFDNAFIKMELGIFTEWLLDKTLGLKLSDDEQQMLKRTFDFLSEQCQKQPQVAMHRDFHSRNIMVATAGGGEPSILSRFAVIDYQDMVKGPLGYDAASLIFDCYTEVEPWLSEKMMDYAYSSFSLSGILDKDSTSREDFERMIVICAIQRHIKCLGIFNRLKLRDGKDGYLQYLPRVLNYLLTNCALFDELAPFKAFLENKVQGHI